MLTLVASSRAAVATPSSSSSTPTTAGAAPLPTTAAAPRPTPAGAAPSIPRANEPPTSPSFNERLWYRAPARQQRALSEQIVDQLAELGNELGTHLDLLSMELLALRVDGRGRRVHLGLGAGESGGYLSFHLGSEFHFIDGVARVTTRVDLCIAGRDLALELPEMELAPTSYRGERGVEIRLPLIQKRF